MNRRAYGVSLLACLAGAALALYALTRTWSVRVTPRAGLSDLRTVRTGVEVAPLAVGLSLVALAGMGALLATRGRVRRALGVLLAGAGAGIAVAAIAGRAGLDVARAGVGGTIWPVTCAAGGAIIVLAGLAAARGGHRWPTMSARYERRSAASRSADYPATWDALDRGEDPTA